MSEPHGAPISPTSHMLQSLGITRQDLHRHTTQMRSFLSNGAPVEEEAAPYHASPSEYATSTVPGTARTPQGQSCSRRGTDDGEVKEEGMEDEDMLPQRHFNSMDQVMERKRVQKLVEKTASHAGINLDAFMNSRDSKRSRRTPQDETPGGHKQRKTSASSSRRSSKPSHETPESSSRARQDSTNSVSRLRKAVFDDSPLPDSSPLAPSPMTSPEREHDPSLPYRLPPGPYLTTKPAQSYSAIIGRAILSSPKHRLTLQEIYSWMMTVFPYYRVQDKTWQSSIRHVLSTTACFRKVPRPRAEGRTLWAIFDDDVPCFAHGGFNKMLCKEMAEEVLRNPNKKEKPPKAKKRVHDFTEPDEQTRKRSKIPETAGQRSFSVQPSASTSIQQPQQLPATFVLPPGYTMVPVYAAGSQAGYFTLVGTAPVQPVAPGGTLAGVVFPPLPASVTVGAAVVPHRTVEAAPSAPSAIPSSAVRPPSSSSSNSSSASLPVLSPNRSSSSDNITTPEQDKAASNNNLAVDTGKKGGRRSSGRSTQSRVIEEPVEEERTADNDGETSSMGYSRSGSSFVDDTLSLVPSRASSSWDATSNATSNLDDSRANSEVVEVETRADSVLEDAFEAGFLLRAEENKKSKGKAQYKQNPPVKPVPGSPTNDRKSAARPRASISRRPMIRMTSSSLGTAVHAAPAPPPVSPPTPHAGYSRRDSFSPRPAYEAPEDFPPSSSPPREGFSTPPPVLSPYDNVSNMRTPIPHQALDLSPSPSLAAHFKSHLYPKRDRVDKAGGGGPTTPDQGMGIDPAMFASEVRTPPPRARTKRTSSIFPTHPLTPKNKAHPLTNPSALPLMRTLSPYYATPGRSPYRGVYDPHDAGSMLEDELSRIRDLDRPADSPDGIGIFARTGMLYESPTMSSPSQWE